jgi:hypothetical protein
MFSLKSIQRKHQSLMIIFGIFANLPLRMETGPEFKQSLKKLLSKEKSKLKLDFSFSKNINQELS